MVTISDCHKAVQEDRSHDLFLLAVSRGFVGNKEEWRMLLGVCYSTPVPAQPLHHHMYLDKGEMWYVCKDGRKFLLWTKEDFFNIMNPERDDRDKCHRIPQYRGMFSSQHYLPGEDLVQGDTALVDDLVNPPVTFIYDDGCWWPKD